MFLIRAYFLLQEEDATHNMGFTDTKNMLWISQSILHKGSRQRVMVAARKI